MKQTVEKLYTFFLDIIFGSQSEKTWSYEAILSLPPSDDSGGAIHSLFCYKTSRTKRLIWNVKYKGNRYLTKIISKILHDAILADLSDRQAFANFMKPVIIPIPATPHRIKEHGFNQCERIAREIDSIDGGQSFSIETKVLIKTKDTQSQAHTKGKALRLNNLKNSFGIKDPEKIYNRNIILIDDVWTTGATIDEARKVLMKAGARSVVAYTIAH